MSKYIENLIEFLKENPSPAVKVISTLVPGAIVCIKSVPTLFGAEVHCNSDVYDEVISTIGINKWK